MSDFKLFDALAAADAGNYSYPDQMDEANRAELDRFCQFPALRWMSAASDEDIEAISVQSVNIINANWWHFYDHPKLRWLSLCAIGLRDRTFRRWPRIPGQATSYEERLAERIWPRAKADDIALAVRLHSTKDLEVEAQKMGVQDQELKEMKAAAGKSNRKKK